MGSFMEQAKGVMAGAATRQNPLGERHHFDAAAAECIGQARSAASRDVTAVQGQLQIQEKLLMELRATVEQLVEPLADVLAGDPRNKTAAGNAQPMPEFSCRLEGQLIERNAVIRAAIEDLNEIRGLIRL